MGETGERALRAGACRKEKAVRSLAGDRALRAREMRGQSGEEKGHRVKGVITSLFCDEN